MFKLMGSTYFFKEYTGFSPHDTDLWEIIETSDFKVVRTIRGQGKDYFQFRKQPTTQTYIDIALQSNLPMVVGKFLIPEFCKEIGFTIKDLSKLKPLIDKLDEKHKYEEIIYNAYLANGDFVLTQTQRDQAYESYKKTRNL